MFRRPLSHSWLFFSLLLLTAFSGARLDASPHGSEPPIVCSVEAAFEYSASGFRAPFRVKLENTTGTDRKATLQFRERWHGDSGPICTYPFFIPAGESVQTVVYPFLTGNLAYEVKETHEGVSFVSTNTTIIKKRYVVIQEGSSTDWHLLSEAAYDASVSSCDLMKWPADYRMYEGQTCLIIPENTFLTYFDEAHRKAIRQWVMGGGCLWLIGDRGQPVSTRLLGHGRILRVPSLDGPAKEKRRQLADFLKLHEQGNSYPELSSTAPYYFSTPSAMLGLALIIFAVLVGPLSLFLWAPAGKRQRLFLLIPAISLGFSLLLLLLILIGDGTGGKGCREVLIQINPQDHSALITQNQICKTSVLLDNTFQLPENAGITGEHLSATPGSPYPKKLENTTRQGEQCGGNWFTSRSTLRHQLIMPVSTRAELTLLETLPGGEPVLQSTFPGTLTGLIYRDASGKYWALEQLPPGRKMQAVPFLPAGKSADPPPGHFRASMDPAGGELGPIPTLPSINWEKTHITVSGPITPQPHE